MFKYSASFAKVQAMSGKLLTNKDYDELLGKSTVGEIASYLKNNTHFSKDLQGVLEADIHRGQLEEILNEAKERDFIKLIKFTRGNNKKFLLTYVLKYELELLKEMVRLLKSGLLYTFYHDVSKYYADHMTIDVEKLTKSKDITQFIENLKGTPFYNIFSKLTLEKEDFNIFNVEMMLDIYYFKQFYQNSKKLLPKKDFMLTYGLLSKEADVLNIMWIIRSKKYFNMPKEIIYSFLMPIGGKIKDRQINALVEAKSESEIQEILSKTPYYHIFQSEVLFTEQHFQKYLNDQKQKIVRLMPYCIVTILSYISRREIELANIIKIIEGKRYKLGADEIEPYLIRIGNGGAA